MYTLLFCLMLFQGGHDHGHEGHDHSGHNHGHSQEQAVPKKELTPEEEKEQKDQIAYHLGHQLGDSLVSDGVELDVDKIIQGLKDALKGKNAYADVDVRELMSEFRREIMSNRRKAAEIEAEKQRKSGRDFLVENAKREDVQVMENGIQYRIIKAGDGPKPDKNGKVKVHYRGTLIDGTEFDSSYKRDEPASFSLRAVIAGWREAIPEMPVGSKWEIFVPADKAYGSRGSGRKIPPFSTLIFEIELIEIVN